MTTTTGPRPRRGFCKGRLSGEIHGGALDGAVIFSTGDFLSRADRALYKAKTGGRNRTEGWKAA